MTAPFDLAEATRLYDEEGLPLAGVAKRMGVSYIKVRNEFRAAGVPLRTHGGANNGTRRPVASDETRRAPRTAVRAGSGPLGDRDLALVLRDLADGARVPPRAVARLCEQLGANHPAHAMALAYDRGLLTPGRASVE